MVWKRNFIFLVRKLIGEYRPCASYGTCWLYWKQGEFDTVRVMELVECHVTEKKWRRQQISMNAVSWYAPCQNICAPAILYRLWQSLEKIESLSNKFGRTHTEEWSCIQEILPDVISKMWPHQRYRCKLMHFICAPANLSRPWIVTEHSRISRKQNLVCT